MVYFIIYIYILYSPIHPLPPCRPLQALMHYVTLCLSEAPLFCRPPPVHRLLSGCSNHRLCGEWWTNQIHRVSARQILCYQTVCMRSVLKGIKGHFSRGETFFSSFRSADCAWRARGSGWSVVKCDKIVELWDALVEHAQVAQHWTPAGDLSLWWTWPFEVFEVQQASRYRSMLASDGCVSQWC